VEREISRQILVIGIGAGDPDYVTVQAVNAINEADVFFVVDKGPDKSSLVELREEILRRHRTAPPPAARGRPEPRATANVMRRA